MDLSRTLRNDCVIGCWAVSRLLESSVALAGIGARLRIVPLCVRERGCAEPDPNLAGC